MKMVTVLLALSCFGCATQATNVVDGREGFAVVNGTLLFCTANTQVPKCVNVLTPSRFKYVHSSDIRVFTGSGR